MRQKKFILIAMSILLMSAGIKVARAEITLCDWLTVTGFFRYEVGFHYGEKNVYNTDQTSNNLLNFNRETFLTEWTAKPSDCFKLVAKIRIEADQAQSIGDALGSYNAFPNRVTQYPWTMLKMAGNDEYRIEANELYADLSFGNLWVRVGKQQIVWGEMIASRIMDVVNPLDYSRNLLFEPEEFDNIRIPEWALRGRYQFGKVGPVSDLMLEGFVIPGDVQPSLYGPYGSPFNNGTTAPNFPAFFSLNNQEPRGDFEFGFRTGGMIHNVYLTLNYMRLYNTDFLLQSNGIKPDPINGIPILGPGNGLYDLVFNQVYPLQNVFGVTGNYFIAPANTVVTFEGTWTPDAPYADAAAFAATQTQTVKDVGTWNYAVRLDRETFVFPRPTSAMMVQLEFNQTVHEGDPSRILWLGNTKVNKTDESVILQLDQFFHHNDFEVTLLGVYNVNDGNGNGDGEYLRQQIRYFCGNHWIFDVYNAYTSGSDTRPYFIGHVSWAKEAVCRITYQF